LKIEYSKDKKRLLIPAEKWDFNNPPLDIIDLAESMVEFLLKENGLGLAYNQLELPGSYSIFCMRGEPENFFLINPRLVFQSEEKIELEEACLSYKGLIFPITRSKTVKIRFQGPDQQTYTKTFTNMTARVIQHEMDHLAGIPFWNSISKLQFDRHIKKGYKKGHDFRNLTYKGI
jgi:peptide deformylase